MIPPAEWQLNAESKIRVDYEFVCIDNFLLLSSEKIMDGAAQSDLYREHVDSIENVIS